MKTSKNPMGFSQNDWTLYIIQWFSTKSNENQWNINYLLKKVLKNYENNDFFLT